MPRTCTALLAPPRYRRRAHVHSPSCTFSMPTCRLHFLLLTSTVLYIYMHRPLYGFLLPGRLCCPCHVHRLASASLCLCPVVCCVAAGLRPALLLSCQRAELPPPLH